MAWIWFSRMKLRPKLKYIINYFIIYVAIEITLYAVILNHKLFYNELHYRNNIIMSKLCYIPQP